MSLTFPDNDNRAARIRELAVQTQDDLHDAESDYKTFQAMVKATNPKIAAVYQGAGLTAPATTSIDILKLQNQAVDGASAPVEIVKILVDIAGFAGTLKYLAPGATRFLVSAGAMSAETAARVLVEFTIPVIGREVSITAGDIAGGILGGIVGGIAIAGIDIGIDGIEGRIARDKMQSAIHQLFPIRLSTRVVRERASKLVLSIQSVQTTMDAITDAGLPLTDKILQNLITKDVQPAILSEQQITPETVAAELAKLDRDSNSWTNEDT
ncbi:hypothetical protein [Bradyrhizobium elkanii]